MSCLVWKLAKPLGGKCPHKKKKKFYKIIQHDINIFFQGDKCFPRRNLTAAYGFEISTPVWVKNKRKSKLKNWTYYWRNLQQNL